MFETSVIYSMGTALNRARDHDLTVQLLVGNEWLTGTVIAVDGHGVVLQTEILEHVVVRMESVAAVRIFAQVPERFAIPNQASYA